MSRMLEVKYSFVVPVYNVEKYIKYCINSLIGQTYTSFEIIIVDDGSTDKSGQIADEYQKKYPTIISVVHQNNTGQGGARNHGVELARGKYILFVDSDDYVSAQMLEIIDEYLKENDDDILFFEWTSVKENKIGWQENVEFLNLHHAMSKADYVYQQPSPWRKVYKSSLFKNKDLRFPQKIYYEDFALAPCFVLDAKTIGVIEEKLYYYVQRVNSTMHSRNIVRILDIIPAFNIIMVFFEKNELVEKYYKELEWLAVQHVLYYSTCRISTIGYFPNEVKVLFDFIEKWFPNYKENPYIELESSYINLDELRALINGGYKKFDKKYYFWFRKNKWIRYHVKKILGMC